MITAKDVARLLNIHTGEITNLAGSAWAPGDYNPLQVIAPKTGSGMIGYLKYLSETALILSPIIPIEKVKEETELLAVDTLVPLEKIDLIFKLPNKSEEKNDNKNKKSDRKRSSAKSK